MFFCILFGSYLSEKASVWAENLTDGRVCGVLCNYEEKLQIKEKSLLFYRAFNFLLFSIVLQCFNPLYLENYRIVFAKNLDLGSTRLKLSKYDNFTNTPFREGSRPYLTGL